MRGLGMGWLWVFVAAAVIGGDDGAWGAVSTRPAAGPATPVDVFAEGVLHTIQIRIPAPLWKLMEPGAARRALKTRPDPAMEADVDLRAGPVNEPFAYVRAQLEFDGTPVADVGVRFKGHFSYSVSKGTPRRPFKIDFGHFVSGQRFAGLGELNLNNQAADPSQAREALAFDLLRDMDLPASRTGFALVWLDVPGIHERQLLGLYTLVEEVDQRFLRQHFGTAKTKGLLLKPSGMRGLAYLGDEWKDYQAKLHPKGPVDPALGQRMIDLARLVSKADDAAFGAGIGSHIDVDEFLRYIAVNGAICNMDSFLSTGHNYLLYSSPADCRARIIPWDVHLTFGGYTWVGTDEQIADTSILHPYVDHNRLIERLLAIPECRAAYFGHLRKLIDGPMSPARMSRRLAMIDRHVRAAGEAAAKGGIANSPGTRPAGHENMHPPDVAWFIERRVESIRAQLDKGHAGYVPAFHDPQRVPASWAHAALPARAILKALDADQDGGIDESEFAAAVTRALSAAGVTEGGPADVAAVTRAIAAMLPEGQEKTANARTWAQWLVRQADANRDGQLSAAELIALFNRLKTRTDLDFDGEICGRELLEALVGERCPK